MAVEPIRGCGYRKVGGIYLVSDGPSKPCDRLPFILAICPTCGGGIHFTRGFTWIDFLKLAGIHCTPSDPVWDNKMTCSCSKGCYLCNPQKEKYGLLWVGEAFYSSSKDFYSEAIHQGISKRIAAIPRNFKVGETIVLLAHKKAIDIGNNEFAPAIFTSFIPKRVEKLLWARDADKDTLSALAKQGITSIIIPDGDVDHDPSTTRKVNKDDVKRGQDELFLKSLRDKLYMVKNGIPAPAPAPKRVESDWDTENGDGGDDDENSGDENNDDE